jgi:Putative MetA-pathway of phenol degradation
MHFDWGASQFLTKQFQIGLVGYVYDEAGCDSGSGDRVGCFQSRVVGLGPQVEFIIPMCRLGDLGRVAGTPDCPIRSGGGRQRGAGICLILHSVSLKIGHVMGCQPYYAGPADPRVRTTARYTKKAVVGQADHPKRVARYCRMWSM